jgi:sulfur relay (sulfurtransferase) DsrC/TusE family protein
MAFKVTVDYQNLRLIIDSDSTESVNTFAQTKALVDFVNLQNSLHYVNLTAADVLLDADTKNLYFSSQYDSPQALEVTVSDLIDTIDTALGKSDSTTLTENAIKAIGKGVSDSVALTEVLAKSILFVRVFSDTYSVSDAIDSLDTGLGKTDSLTLSEAEAKLFETPKSDSLSLSEVDTKLFSLGKADTPILSENIDAIDTALIKSDTATLSEALDSISTSLPKTDSFTLSENALLLVGLNKTDSVSLSESLARVVTYVREFSDGFTLDDRASVTDELQTDIGLVKGNIVTMLEDSSFALSKPAITASVTMQDVLTYAGNFVQTDSVNVSDVQTFDTGLGKDDSIAVTEDLNLDNTLVKSEVLSILEAISLAPSLTQSDSFSLSESLVYSSSLSKADIVTLSEALAQSVSKSLSDSVTISESISVLFVPGGTSVLNTAALNTSVLN